MKRRSLRIILFWVLGLAAIFLTGFILGPCPLNLVFIGVGVWISGKYLNEICDGRVDLRAVGMGMLRKERDGRDFYSGVVIVLVSCGFLLFVGLKEFRVNCGSSDTSSRPQFERPLPYVPRPRPVL